MLPSSREHGCRGCSGHSIVPVNAHTVKGLLVNIPIATNLGTPYQMWLYTGILFVDSPNVMVN